MLKNLFRPKGCKCNGEEEGALNYQGDILKKLMNKSKILTKMNGKGNMIWSHVS